ncbi:MAG: hypothetical protein H6825_06375 [Planctomycetes bacterium]|nr:hypothetical protein [Planctomycetota bacterium]
MDGRRAYQPRRVAAVALLVVLAVLGTGCGASPPVERHEPPPRLVRLDAESRAGDGRATSPAASRAIATSTTSPSGASDAAGAAPVSALHDDPAVPLVVAPPPPAISPVPAGREALAHVTLRELSGETRVDEPLRIGVPFVAGALVDVATLRAWDASDGGQVVCQTRALSRWPDGSARWVLVDVRGDLAPRRTRTLAIGPADDLPAAPDPWTLETGADGVVRASDGVRSWTVLAPAPDGDRVLGLRAELLDRFGYRYHGFATSEVSVLERGPLRMTLVLHGEHTSDDPLALDVPFHTFTAWLHLHAGTPLAEVEWSLENGPLVDPPGPLAFRSYVLETDAPDDVRTLRVCGRSLAPDEPLAAICTAAGTRVYEGARPQPLSPGDLWAGLAGGTHDLWVHRMDSAGNHPDALRWRPHTPLQIQLLAPGNGNEFFLDDASRKTFRLTLARDAGAEGEARMRAAAEPSGVTLSPLEVAISGAWGDAGHVHLLARGEKRLDIGPPKDPPTGWADYGEAVTKNTHTSGSPRNKLSVFLEAMQSERTDLFRWDRTRAFHAMDMRPYHIIGFDADAMPWANLYEGVPHPNNKPSESLGRAGMATRHTRYKDGLPPNGHGYDGFDPEHMTLDDVYECYLLTGSWPALDALHSAGEAMLTWQELRPDGWIHSSRTFGWTLRALVQVFRATGERRYLDAARRYVARADAERGHGDVKYLREMKPDPRHLEEPHDTLFMVAVALHGLSAYFDETRDPIVPPMCVDLTAFCMSGYRGASGFIPDLPTRRVQTAGVAQADGVSTWIPGAIAAASFVTGDREPVDRLRPYVDALTEKDGGPLVFGHKDWHWWQPHLAAVRLRERGAKKTLRERDPGPPDTSWVNVPEWTEGLVEEPPLEPDWPPPEDDGGG